MRKSLMEELAGIQRKFNRKWLELQYMIALQKEAGKVTYYELDQQAFLPHEKKRRYLQMLKYIIRGRATRVSKDHHPYWGGGVYAVDRKKREISLIRENFDSSD